MSEKNICITTAVGLGVFLFFLAELPPMFLLWAGMLYLREEILIEINFFSVEQIRILGIMLWLLVASAQGFIVLTAWHGKIWKKALNKIGKGNATK